MFYLTHNAVHGKHDGKIATVHLNACLKFLQRTRTNEKARKRRVSLVHGYKYVIHRASRRAFHSQNFTNGTKPSQGKNPCRRGLRRNEFPDRCLLIVRVELIGI